VIRLVGAAVSVVLAAGGLGGAQVRTFRTGIDLVSFSVTVTGKKGEFITDLGQDDFEVHEDGVRQAVTYFRAGGPAGPDPAPLHLGALLDISGSMQEDMSLSRTAAIKFLKTFSDAEDMTLVDFDTEVRVARYSPSDFPSLVERIRSRKADGNTALYDAVAVYLDGAVRLSGRKILLLYTDGGDNDSRISFSDALTLLRAADVTVYAVGLLQHQGNAALDLRLRLQQMAGQAGGQSFFPSSIKDLDGVYEMIRDEIRAQYSLGYLSTNPKQDGAWRKVSIRIARDRARNVKVRTRPGYFAPYSKTATRSVSELCPTRSW
jgi:VWFA-related protein